MRDDFSARTKRALAERAGYICSNPDCRKRLIGPTKDDGARSTHLGKAAHICAAAKGGPRYNSAQTSEERKSIDNAIYLCGGCADMIDKHGGKGYSAEILQTWRSQHIKWISKQLNESADSAAGLSSDSKLAQEILNLTRENNALLQGIGSNDDLKTVSSQSKDMTTLVVQQIPDTYTTVIDSQITRIALKKKFNPQTTYSDLEALLTDLADNLTPNLEFRIKANMALCLLEMSDEKRGGALLLEACDCDPAGKNSASNRIIGTLATAGPAVAIALCQELIVEHKNDPYIWSYYLQALRTEVDNLSVFDDIPVLLRDNEAVIVGKVILARKINDDIWITLAQDGNAKYPNSSTLRQSAADSYLHSVLESEDFKERRVITTKSNKALDSAIALYTALWDDTADKPFERENNGVSDLANLILAYDLRNQGMMAMKLCVENQAYIETNPLFAERACLIGIRNDNLDLVDKALPFVKNPMAATMFKFQHAAATKDLDTLGSMSDDFIDNIDEPDRDMARTLRDLAKIKPDDMNQASEHIKVVFANSRGRLREMVLCVDFAEDFGNAATADALYQEAANHISADDNYVDRHMLYYRALRRNDFTTVLKCLDGFVSTDVPSRELNDLAWAFVNQPFIDEDTMAFFDNLAPSVRKNAFLLQMEGAMHFKRGDLIAAHKLLRSSFDEEKQAEALISLVQTLRRLNDDKSIETLIRKIDLSELRGALSARILVCRFFAQNNRGPEALSYAYKVLLGSRLDGDAVVQYVMLIMHDGQHCDLSNPSVVTVDTEVEYKDKHGKIHKVFITDNDTADEGDYYKSSHKLAKNLNSLSVGDVLSPDGMQNESPIEITSIKNGAIALSHNYMAVLSKRFPEQQGITVFTTVGDDLDPFLDQLRGFEKSQIQAANNYAEKNLPLFAAGHFVGMNAIAFSQFLNRRGYKIKSNVGNEAAFDAELSLLLDPADTDICLDTYTLWVLYQLELLEPLAALYKSVTAPRSAYDTIVSLRDKFAQRFDEEESLSLQAVDGQIYKDVQSKSERQETYDSLDDICKKANETVEFLPVTAPIIESDLIQLFAEMMGTSGVEPLFLCGDEKVLLSEDFQFRNMARETLKTKAVGLLPVLVSLLVHKAISEQKRSKSIAMLAAMGHSFITVSKLDVYSALVDQEDLTGEKFDLVSTELLGTYGYSRDHVLLAAEVLNSASIAHGSSGINIERGLGIILTRIYKAHKDKAPELVLGLFDELRFNLRDYIREWHKGHFISFKDNPK